jgi:hypothetical protein
MKKEASGARKIAAVIAKSLRPMMNRNSQKEDVKTVA